MAIPCPQRDALEALERTTKSWPKGLGLKSEFQLQDGTTVYLLGVSNGTGARPKPDLHIAVFGLRPPRREPENHDLLARCQFGALLQGPEDGNRFTVEGLNVESSHGRVVVLCTTGQCEVYRSI